MRLRFLLIFLLVSSAQALTVNVNHSSINNELVINYELLLDVQEVINYSIILQSPSEEYEVINESRSIKDLISSVNYNLNSVTAGNYSVILKVSSPSLSINKIATNPLIVQTLSEIRTSTPSEAQVIGNETIITATVTNYGNINASISAYFINALSDITVTPQSFNLGKNETRNITITITKPAINYNTTLIIQSGSERTEYTINVIIPVINLTMNKPQILESRNETIINTQVTNNGNVITTANLSINTFTITELFKTETSQVTINPQESINHTITLPRKEIISITLAYNNGTSIITETQELSWISRMKIELPTDKIALASILLLILVFIYFKIKKTKNKRP